jgi:hypothetical protein
MKDFVPGRYLNPSFPDAKPDSSTPDCDLRLCACSTRKNRNRKLIQHFGGETWIRSVKLLDAVRIRDKWRIESLHVFECECKKHMGQSAA